MSQTVSTVAIDDLRELVATALEMASDELSDDASFGNDLEIDSLMRLEIAARLEDRYAISLEDSEMAGVSTLIDLKTLVAAKVAGQ
jgi:acyl carrier protein